MWSDCWMLYMNKLRLFMAWMTTSRDPAFLTIPCSILSTFLSQNRLIRLSNTRRSCSFRSSHPRSVYRSLYVWSFLACLPWLREAAGWSLRWSRYYRFDDARPTPYVRGCSTRLWLSLQYTASDHNIGISRFACHIVYTASTRHYLLLSADGCQLSAFMCVKIMWRIGQPTAWRKTATLPAILKICFDYKEMKRSDK